MRIVIVNNHMVYALGGSEVQSDIIGRELCKRGHEIYYITPGRYDRVEGVPYSIIGCERGGIGEAVLGLCPDIVYWRFYHSRFRETAKMIKRAGIPFVFVLNNSGLLKKWRWDSRNKNIIVRILKGLRDRWQFGGYRYVDILVSNLNEWLFKLDIEKQYYIPNTMSGNYREFSWNKPYCAWIGNIRECKRPEKYIELAYEMKNTGIDLLMAGEIMDDNYRWIEGGDLPSNFHYLGRRDLEEVNGIMKGSLMHIHTCRPEGFGNVFIQAWMQGRPTVSLGFDPDGHIGSKRIGYCADDDMTLFCDYVKKLIYDEDLREEMGKRAGKLYEELFAIDAVMDKLEGILREEGLS